MPEDKSFVSLSYPGYRGRAKSTISGKAGISKYGLKRPTSAYPKHMSTRESAKPNISDGPTKRKLMEVKSAETIMITLFSIQIGNNCTAILDGM